MPDWTRGTDRENDVRAIELAAEYQRRLAKFGYNPLPVELRVMSVNEAEDLIDVTRDDRPQDWRDATRAANRAHGTDGFESPFAVLEELRSLGYTPVGPVAGVYVIAAR